MITTNTPGVHYVRGDNGAHRTNEPGHEGYWLAVFSDTQTLDFGSQEDAADAFRFFGKWTGDVGDGS